MRLRVAGLGPDPDAPLIAVERRAALLPLYTAITIVAGLGALVLVTLFGTLPAAIALPGFAGPWGGVAGIAVWTLFGLAGSMKVVRGPSGHGVLTFHLPFIVAAMVLGGPIAGGWVAFIASFERRELREMPWYGALANHAGLALAAILGGRRCPGGGRRRVGPRAAGRPGRHACRGRRSGRSCSPWCRPRSPPASSSCATA